MAEITTIGVDLAKSVFQVRGVDAEGAVFLRRNQMLELLQRLGPCLVGMEACAEAHRGARELPRQDSPDVDSSSG